LSPQFFTTASHVSCNSRKHSDRKARKEGQGIATASLAPPLYPRGVMSRINKRMSVSGVTKCYGVQTLFVIGVTITLVSSCWARAFPTPAPAVPSSQQLGAINSAFLIITPPPTRYKEGRDFGYPPKKLPLFTESPRRLILGNPGLPVWGILRSSHQAAASGIILW